MNLTEQAHNVITKFKDLETKLSDPQISSNIQKLKTLGRERKTLEVLIVKANNYLELTSEIQEWQEAFQSDDREMQQAANDELPPLRNRLTELEDEFKVALIPKDVNDFKNALIEIRAGTGGDEASLFVGDLFRMYSYYFDSIGWKTKVVSCTEGTSGGFKEVVCEIQGEECYGTLKYESGVHRVQRVPNTESQGRVHTSAATVAIMPEAEEIDIQISENDLRIDVYRASGNGGQSVNTTDSAVRITHEPTGLVVTCQDEKSQLKNKEKAMKVLRSRLLDLEIASKEKERSQQRKVQVGTGDRSAKIRTYNFPQGRVTDHRINVTLYSLDAFMKGNVQEIIDALKIQDTSERLKELDGSNE